MADSQFDIQEVIYLHRWAVGRPILIAISAQLTAASTPILIGLLEKTRAGVFAKALHAERMKTDWLHLYRDPGLMRSAISKTIYPERDGTAHAGLADFLRHRQPAVQQIQLPPLESLPAEFQLQVREQIEMGFRCQYLEHLAELAATLNERNIGPAVDVEHMVSLPEVQFFLMVMVPCILEYGETPSRLYAKARRGDLQTLDKLLRIDKSVMFDERIRPYVENIEMQRDELIGDIVLKAYIGSPGTSLDVRNFKARQAAYLVQVSEYIGAKLKPVEIRRLFDAAEKDRSGDQHAIDTDIPDGDEAWRQAVHRAKPFWGLDLDRDKLNLSTCHAELLLSAVVSDPDGTETTPAWLDKQTAAAGETTSVASSCRMWNWFKRIITR